MSQPSSRSPSVPSRPSLDGATRPAPTAGAGKRRSDSFDHGEAAPFVYAALKERIFDGRLPPGVRIVETAVADEFGVSRTPVREAIHRLISEGIVERTSGRGLAVVELTGEEIEDLYVTRMVLEGLAARLTAVRRSEHDLATLTAIQHAMEAALVDGDASRIARINFEFHAEIQRIAGNSTTARFMVLIHEAVRRFGTTTLALPERAASALAEHRALIDAFDDRDADRAEAIARSHIEGALRARLTILTRRRLQTKGTPE